MKVFISSTFEDLKDERIRTKEVIEHFGFLWDWMEEERAAPHTTLLESVDRIKECDYFVGIYAHRYGTIPDNEKQSITELEYIEARKMGLPKFCFLSSRAADPSVDQDDSKKIKLQNFLDMVRKENTVKEFKDLTELTLAVEEVMSRIPSSSAEPKWWSLIPPWHVEREILMRNMAFSVKNRSCILVCGHKGSGRSTLAAHFLKTTYLPQVNWQDCGAEQSLHAMFVKMAKMEHDNLDPLQLCKRVLAKLRLNHNVLVLDDFSREWAGGLLLPLCKALENEEDHGVRIELRLILVSEDETLMKDSPLLQNQIHIDALEEDEAKRLVQQFLEKKFGLQDRNGEHAELISKARKFLPGEVIRVTETMGSGMLAIQCKRGLFAGKIPTEEFKILWQHYREHGNPLMALECLLELTEQKDCFHLNKTLIEVMRDELKWQKAAFERELDIYGRPHRLSGVNILKDILSVNSTNGRWERVIEEPNLGFKPLPIDEFLSQEQGKRLVYSILSDGKGK